MAYRNVDAVIEVFERQGLNGAGNVPENQKIRGKQNQVNIENRT